MGKVFTVLLIVCTIIPCAAQPRAENFDKAIANATASLKEKCAGSKVAILNIQSDYLRLSRYVIESLSASIVSDKSEDKMVEVDRRELESLQREKKYQLSGEVADEEIQSIGKQLGAQFVITGSIELLKDTYLLRIKATEISSAHIVSNRAFQIKKDETVAELIKDPKGEKQTSEPPPPTPPPTSQPRRTAFTWKDKYIWFGGIVGYSQSTYSLYESSGDPSIGNRDFDYIPTFYGGYLSFQLGSFLAFHVEADYISDYFTVSDGLSQSIFETKSLMIPGLLKLTLRPAIFLLQGYGGVYYNLPLSNLSINNDEFEVLSSFGWIAGGSIGIWIGLGVLYFDIRVGDSFGYTQINYGDNTIDAYKRFLTSYSIGLEFGLFNKN